MDFEYKGKLINHEEFVKIANEIHRETLRQTYYLPIPQWWFEEPQPLEHDASDDNLHTADHI